MHGESVKNYLNRKFVSKHHPSYFLTIFIKSMILSSFFISNSHAEGFDNTLNAIRNAPENSWIKMNTNSFSDAWVPLQLRPFNQGSYADPSRVIDAWSSFAWDSNRGDLLIFGGGHANYGGNEVYRWSGSTLKWELASLPTAIEPNYIPKGGSQYAPQSSHTYDNATFLPVADRFVTFGGAAFQSGTNFVSQNTDGSFSRTGPYFFDPSKADPAKIGGADFTGVDPNIRGGFMWDNRDSYANVPSGTTLPGSVTGTTDYSYQNGKEVIYVSGPDGGGTQHMLASLTISDYNDPSKDVWKVLGINWNGSGYAGAGTWQGAGAYDPVENLYIKSGGPDHQFSFWDLDTAGPSNKNIVVNLASAPSDFKVLGQYGFEYDPLRNDFLLWGGNGDVFELNVGNKDGTNWTVTKLVNDGTQTPGNPTSGVLGKWHYASNFDVFVGLEGSVDGNVWFYKPAGWIDPSGSPVPLPGGLLLMMSGLGYLVASNRRKVV